MEKSAGRITKPPTPDRPHTTDPPTVLQPTHRLLTTDPPTILEPTHRQPTK